MLGADAVPKPHLVLIAWTAAVPVISPSRKKCAEHAMLHVKHWNVLVNRHFEPIRWRAPQQGVKLRNIQVIRSGHTLEAVTLHEVFRGQFVSDVERKIADQARTLEESQMIVIAH